jgi:hypothetical protein
MSGEFKDIVVSVFQYASWPLAFLVALWWFRTNLRGLIGELRLQKAGSVEFDFKERMQRQDFTAAQMAIFKQLSVEEIELFLMVSYSDSGQFFYHLGDAMDFAAFRLSMGKLDQAGLMRLLNPEDDGQKLRHSITSLGKNIRALLIDSSVGLMREVSTK